MAITCKKLFATVVLCCLTALTLSSCSDAENGGNFDGLLISPSKMELAPEDADTALVIGGHAPFTVTLTDETVASAFIKGDSLFVTGLKAGKAIVTVTDSLQFSGHVSVNVLAPDSLAFDIDSVSIGISETDSVTIMDGQAPYEALSADPAVATATVDGDRIAVLGIAAGNTTISVSDKNGKKGLIAVVVE